MSIFNELEDAVYAALIALHPTRKFIFAYNNAPEIAMPYTVINIMKNDAVGMASQDSSSNLGFQTTLQTYEAKVQLETHGEMSDQYVAGSIASELDFSLRTPLMRDALTTKAISLIRYKPITRFSRTRDTKTFMVYQQDLFFGYVIRDSQDVGYINTLDLEATYHDAGRAGNTITSTIHIASPI